MKKVFTENNINKDIKKSEIFCLSFLALPLSFVGIPIYLNIGEFYARKFNIDLVWIGILLIVVRLADAIQDPFIGNLSDKLIQKNYNHKKLIFIFSLFLSITFYLVFNPPGFLTKNTSIIWFFVSINLTYFCFNFVIINFESLIATIAKNDIERFKLNSFKEFFGVIGMILAFTIPSILSSNLSFTEDSSYFILSIIFCILITSASFNLLKKLNFKNEVIYKKNTSKLNVFSTLKDKNFTTLILIILINGIAVSLPAANLNFFARNILQKESEIGWMISVYFISACLFIPMWNILSKKFGIIKCWIISISGSILTFSFSFFLTAENANYFYIICLFAGLFLSPDLITPPSLLAKISNNSRSLTSSYFSIWNFSTKISLMIAASGSFILIGLTNYNPSQKFNYQSNFTILFLYSILPCLIKILTIFNLIFFTKKLFPNEK